MDLLHSHLRERLFSSADMEERVFIKDDTLYEHPLLTIGYTTYDLRRDKDSIHLNFGNQAVLVYSPTSQDNEPWLYAHVVAVYHMFVSTRTNPEPKRLELLWVRWMQRDRSQLKEPNSSQYTRISFVPDSGIPGDAFGFVDPSHVIRVCHLIPVFDLQRTRDRLGTSMARDTEGDWRAFYANRCDLHLHISHSPLTLSRARFVDRDAFARFSGIGIGCQRLQAAHVPEIIIGPDAPDPIKPTVTEQATAENAAEPVTTEFDESRFAGCYTIDDDEGVDLY